MTSTRTTAKWELLDRMARAKSRGSMHWAAGFSEVVLHDLHRHLSTGLADRPCGHDLRLARIWREAGSRQGNTWQVILRAPAIECDCVLLRLCETELAARAKSV